MEREITMNKVLQCGVVAVIRAQTRDQLLDIAEALVNGGVVAIEVTMSTPNAIEGIEKLVDVLGTKAVIGVGTVLNAAIGAAAIAAGAEFVVSPVLDTSIIEMTRKLGKVSIPGAFTPSEILTAWSAGADIVKVFPATTMGPQYLKDLLSPMPFLRMIPTGGVTVKNTNEWIKAGAVAVGAGSSLVSKDLMARGDWAGITALARQFVEAVSTARVR
ncbi:MAG: bifunctional 4-hydroxy-2-oxoglutarate aldolase/2-dehydro-3-deoxy-phosphogluconate aldolase [Phycisphaerae bacterium]